MAMTYMTPAHRTLVDQTLVAVHNRTTELINAVNYAIGKNPPERTIEVVRQGQLGRDLELIVLYVEGHQVAATDVDPAIQRGFTLNIKGYHLLTGWQKTALGELIGEAYTRLLAPKDLMGTAEVQRAFGVKRPVSVFLTLSRFLFDRGNKVHEGCFGSLFSSSDNHYLDKHDLVKHVY